MAESSLYRIDVLILLYELLNEDLYFSSFSTDRISCQADY